MSRPIPLAAALGLFGLAAAATPARATPGSFYEAYASGTVAAFTLTPPANATAFLADAATNIVATATAIYFQSGNAIYSSSTGLVGLNLVDLTPGTPAGFAVDAADGILYETYGTNGLAAVSLANPRQGVADLNDTATNITFAGGHVYFQDGSTIYETSANLSGITPILTTPTAPTDFAVDPTDGILYETFGAGGVAAISLANTNVGLGSLNDVATNIVANDGMVFFEDGDTIYQTSADLVGLTPLLTTGNPPSGIAFLPPQTATAPSPVPEPGSAGVFAAGLLALAAVAWRRRYISNPIAHGNYPT